MWLLVQVYAFSRLIPFVQVICSEGRLLDEWKGCMEPLDAQRPNF